MVAESEHPVSAASSSAHSYTQYTVFAIKTRSENILFGLPMNEERYRAVLFVGRIPLSHERSLLTHQAVGLLPDLDLLEDSDLTEIGERWVESIPLGSPEPP